jgi:hypothetical protein
MKKYLLVIIILVIIAVLAILLFVFKYYTGKELVLLGDVRSVKMGEPTGGAYVIGFNFITCDNKTYQIRMQDRAYSKVVEVDGKYVSITNPVVEGNKITDFDSIKAISGSCK